MAAASGARRTLERRPDLLDAAALDDEERALLDELIAERKKETDQ